MSKEINWKLSGRVENTYTLVVLSLHSLLGQDADLMGHSALLCKEKGISLGVSENYSGWIPYVAIRD